MKISKSKKIATNPRFINHQRRAKSCGPTAIANVVKWLGYKTTHDKMMEFCAGIGAYFPDEGMWPSGIRLTLRELEIKVKVRRKPSLKDIDAALDAGCAVMTAYRTPSKTTHIVFVNKRTSSSYCVWNRNHETSPWYPKKFIIDALRRSLRHSGHCYTYFISPNQ